MSMPKRSVMVGVIALCTAAVFAGASLYLVQSIGAQVKEMRTLQETRSAQERRVARVAALQRAVRAVAKDALTLEQRFVAREQIVPLLEELESFARRAGVEMTITQVEARARTAEARATTVVSLEAVGAREDVMYLVALLETLPRAARLATLSLRRLASGADRWRADATLVLAMTRDDAAAAQEEAR